MLNFSITSLLLFRIITPTLGVRDGKHTHRRHMEDNVITPRLHRYMEEHGINKDSKDAERQSYKPERDISKGDDDADNVRAELRDMRGKDFLDVSLEHHFKEQQLYPWHVAVFEVLDLIGGSSAVGNLLLRLLGFLSLHPQYQDLIHKEALMAIEKQAKRESEDGYIADKVDEDVGFDVDADGVPIINLMHRRDMPLMDAAIQETLRHASSPIIPHVANKDTSLAGYDIDKETMVLFNTFHLNFSEENWTNPRDFDPRRFLIRADAIETHDHRINENNNGIQYLSPEDDGTVKWLVRKPKNFLPFSVGRRACLGYKLTKSCTFSAAANILLRYRLSPGSPDNQERMRNQLIPKGGLGLPIDETCFNVMMTPRKEGHMQE